MKKRIKRSIPIKMWGAIFYKRSIQPRRGSAKLGYMLSYISDQLGLTEVCR